MPIEQALALGFSIAVSVSQLKTCEEVNGIPGCEEKWCPRCGCHFGDCDCIGVCESEVDYIYGVEDDGAELLMGKRKPSVGKRS